MSKIKVKDLSQIAIVAALYAVLTVAISPLSYGPLQFRFSEALVLLCFYNKRYSWGLILGCFIANCFSPYGVVDMVFGTLSTVVAVLGIVYLSKNLAVAGIWPILSCLIVAGEISIIENLPYFITAAEVLLGEAVIITLVAIPLYKYLESSKSFKYIVGDIKIKDSKQKYSIDYLSISMFAVILIMFFSLPIYENPISSSSVSGTLYSIATDGNWLVIASICVPFLGIILNHFTYKAIRYLLVGASSMMTFGALIYLFIDSSLTYYIASVVLYIIALMALTYFEIIFKPLKERKIQVE